MKKTPEYIHHIVIAAILRSSRDPDMWPHTVIVDDPKGDSARFIAELVELASDEIPILYCYFDPDDWGVFTTHRVVAMWEGNQAEVAYDDIAESDFGLLKDRRSPKAVLLIRAKTGDELRMSYETLKPSMGPIYALQTMLQLDR